MNSQPSTSYTLWGLSRLYLAVLTRDLTTGPIIDGVGLRIFQPKSATYAWRGGGAKMRYFWWNFSRYNVRAWKSYDQPSLNLYNSTIWRATLCIFSEFLHLNTIYGKLAWNLQHDAPFPGKVPVKTPHFSKKSQRVKVQTLWVHVWRAFSQKFVDRLPWNFQGL